jgi:hypothetical protein
MKTILLPITLLVLFSCGKKTDSLEQALDIANKNRKEIESVLAHYKDEPEKLQAAQFLIKNMIGKNTLDTMSVISNQIFFDSLKLLRTKNGIIRDDDFRIVCEDIIKNNPDLKTSTPAYKTDLTFLSSEELISHIDHAFRVKEKYPWCKDVDFDDFCRYVLPYKVETSYWDGTNSFFETKYSHLIDSFSNLSITEIGDYIRTDADETFFMGWDVLSSEYPFLFPATFQNVAKTQIGLCPAYTAYIISAARAIGIPAVLNAIPCYGNSDHQHFWMEVVDRAYAPELYENKPVVYDKTAKELVNGMFNSKATMPPFDHFNEFVTVSHNRRMAKIYRINYENLADNIEFLSGKSDIPSFFRNIGMEDVTNKYVKCSDVEIDLWDVGQNEKTAYLYCYDSGNWTPVCKAEANNNKALFKNVGVNIFRVPDSQITSR